MIFLPFSCQCAKSHQLIDFLKLELPYIPGTISIQSWCIVLLYIAGLDLLVSQKVFASVFIRDTGSNFFLLIHLTNFGITVILACKASWETFPSLLLLKIVCKNWYYLVPKNYNSPMKLDKKFYFVRKLFLIRNSSLYIMGLFISTTSYVSFSKLYFHWICPFLKLAGIKLFIFPTIL